MRELAKQILRKFHLDGFAKTVIQNIRKRKFGRIDIAIINRHFSDQKIKKLHIGCGENVIDDWLNSDFFPLSDKILQLDATKAFPFSNESLDYIFSEHMIEHISYANGFAMLNECYRTLKNNGKIRISTPNLQFLIDLYKPNKSELQKEYIVWATDNFINEAPCYDDIFVINNFVRDWGHLFIYDEKTLRFSMEKAGFTDLVKCSLNESQNELLRNLENEERMPKGFLRLESITFEGTKRSPTEQSEGKTHH